MSWGFTPYVLPLLLPGVMAGALALYIWPRAQARAKPLIALMIAGAVWSVGHAAELMGADLFTKLFCTQLQYFGIVVLPVAWLAVALQHSGKAHAMTRRALVLLMIIPAAALALVWTNEWHGLIWRDMSLHSAGPFSVLAVVHGPGFWAWIAYSYTLFLVGGILLGLTAFHSPALYLGQRVVLLLALAFPWAANLLYVSRAGPSFDLTPFAFTASSLAMALGVFRLQLTDVVQLARSAVMEKMPDGVIVLDHRNRIIDVNPQAERIIDASVSDVIGLPIEDAFARSPLLIERLAADSEAEVEIPLETCEEPYIYTARVAQIRNRRETPIGRLIIFHDITERKKAEETLEKERATLDRLMELNPFSISIYDAQGHYVRGNRAHLDLFRAPPPPPDYSIFDDPILVKSGYAEELLKLKKGEVVEVPGLRYNVHDLSPSLPDHPVIVNGVAFPLLDEDGNLEHIVVMRQDITKRKRAEAERRRLEEQMQQTQKLQSLGVLAGGIAHDFNNILMAILGNADLALADLSDVSPAWPRIQEIRKGVRRAADLCKQMLAYSGRGKLVIRPIDLNEVVDEMAHLLKTSIAKKAALNLHLDRKAPSVKADAAQMQQVVMNLITNASEAIGEDSGAITISTGVMDCDRDYLSRSYLREEQPEGLYVYIEVADTGCGMDEATQAKLFEPFFTTKFTGRGLGLAAVLGIVRGHNGAIMLDSKPGQGTTFRVLFPALDEPAESLTEEKPTPVEGTARKRHHVEGMAPKRHHVEGMAPKRHHVEEWRPSGTILLVDDDEALRSVGKSMLESVGFDVLTAGDGREAVRVYRENVERIACVLLDLTMPHMDGAEALQELRRVKDDVRVVLASGYTEEDVQNRFAGQDIAAFIHKPYETADLVAKIKQVLGG